MKRIKILKFLKPAVMVAVLLCPLLLIAGRAAATTYLAQTLPSYSTGCRLYADNRDCLYKPNLCDNGGFSAGGFYRTGYTVNTTLTNWAVNATSGPGWPTGGTPWPGIGSQATAAALQTVTFSSTALAPGTLYCFNWTNTAALTTGSSPSTTNSGTVTTYTGGSVQIDTGTYITDTLTGDQILVSASLAPTFSFVLSANADSLGVLTPGTIKSSAPAQTVTINTNARNGWILWGKDQYGGLESLSQPSDTIPYTVGNSTLNTLTQGYNTGITFTRVSGTVPTVPGTFTGGTNQGGNLTSSYATLISSTGPAGGVVVSITNNVNIISTTPAAADYTDTITLVGAGQF